MRSSITVQYAVILNAPHFQQTAIVLMFPENRQRVDFCQLASVAVSSLWRDMHCRQCWQIL